jgi:hypothetical protein
VTVKDVAAAVGHSQPITTNHLIVLNRAGLVKDTPEGFSLVQELVGAKVTHRGLELTHPTGVVVVISMD